MCLQGFLQSNLHWLYQAIQTSKYGSCPLPSSIMENIKENEYRSNWREIQSNRTQLWCWLAASWLLLCTVITAHTCHLSLSSAFHIISHYYLNTNLVKPFHSFPPREQLCHLCFCSSKYTLFSGICLKPISISSSSDQVLSHNLSRS